MPLTNVEVVQRWFEAVSRLLEVWTPSRSLVAAMEEGDVPAEVAEVLRYMSAEAEWDPLFSGETYRGRLEMGRALDELREAAENYTSELQEVIDLENDRVLAVFRLKLEGRTSGIHVDQAMYAVIGFADGLIARLDEYAERRQALAAAGVEE
jgi:ketosteroid isomerase-like protein